MIGISPLQIIPSIVSLFTCLFWLCSVYRRPYFTGLRISTQTVSFTIDNFSSFLHKNRTLTALYTFFLLISGPPSDFIEDVELWLARLLSLTIGSPSLHPTCRHSRGERPLTSPHPGNDFEILLHAHTQACGLNQGGYLPPLSMTLATDQ
jgi:hypothetical protein